MKIAVAATAPFGAAVLEGMASRSYDIEFLLTRPDKPAGPRAKEGRTAGQGGREAPRDPRAAAGEAQRVPR